MNFSSWRKPLILLMSNNKRGLVLSMVLLALTGFFETLSVIGLTPIIDLIFNPNLENASGPTKKIVAVLEHFNLETTLTTVILSFMGLIFCKVIVQMISKYWLIKIEYRMLRNLITVTLKEFLDSSWLFFSRNKSGELGNTFITQSEKARDSFQMAALMLANIIRSLFFLGLALSLSLEVTAIMMVLLGITMVPFSKIGKLTYRFNDAVRISSNKLYSIYEETFSQAKLILSYSNQDTAITKIKTQLIIYLDKLSKIASINAWTPIAFEPLGYIIVLASVYAGHSIYKIPGAELLVLLYSIRNFSTLSIQTISYKNRLQELAPSLNQIFELRKLAKELTTDIGDIPVLSFEDQIEFNDVTFEYEKDKKVLDKVNLTIPKGSFVAFTGQSGAGKTTLIDLILKLHTPTSGQISVNGQSLNSLQTSEWRKKIGYVTQEPILFNGTIKDNILWANPEATSKEIENALELANSSQFIQELPETVNTQVKDRGSRLSGGQRQRISMARALVRNPDLLIFDEATSSLDSESESIVQDSILNLVGKKTIISIAHRLSTIKMADVIYYMEEGKVKDHGTFQELFDRSPEFKNLVEKQQLIEK